MIPNPCLTCGACCAHFRASFYWAEADDATPDGVPTHLTDDFPPHFRIMKGTNSKSPRCIALIGQIGRSVYCDIHPRRSTVCRDFPPSYENGVVNERCDQARAAHQLPPLTPEDWLLPVVAEPSDAIAAENLAPTVIIVPETYFADASRDADGKPPEHPNTPPRPAA